MEFCDKCGALMIPTKSGASILLTCRICGKKRKAKDKKFKISSASSERKGKIVVITNKTKIEVLPKTRMSCTNCDSNEAYWWMQQMRSADEAATRFYRCVKCGHVWREYE